MKYFQPMLRDRAFLSTLLALALPITLQSFITSSLSLIDNMMVGTLGEEAIAAVGLANQYMFVFLLCLIGVNAGASIFMSQYWGQRDVSAIKSILGIDITVGFITSLLFGLGALLFPTTIMNILSNDPAVIEIGARYLQIVSMSTLFMNFTQAFSSALRSTEQPKLPMYASIIAVGVNAVLNWVFIFGNLGSPEMGVNGAALATLIARIVEMGIVVVAVYGTNNIVAAKLKELRQFSPHLVRMYFKTSWSVIINELIWSCGMTAYSIAYAQIGTEAVATMQIANTIFNMMLVFLIGLASSASIMIGNKIGANEEETAKTYASYIATLSIVMGLVLGALTYMAAPFMISPFEVSAQTYEATLHVLYVMAITAVLRSFNLVMVVGVFRGGGDTTFAMILQALTMWAYSIPLAFAGASFGLSVVVVYVIISTEELLKMFFQVRRLRSGKWLRNVISSNDTQQPLSA